MDNATMRQLTQQLRQQVATMRQRITRLGIAEDSFHDWFDAQLFRVNHAAPNGYCDEIDELISQLERSASESHQRWLAEKIEQQMLALLRALAHFERKA